jgi:adenylylsulfate kinase
MTMKKGDVLVISGLSGTGKSTLAEGLREILEARGRRVKILDGDGLRTFFDQSLLYSSEDRLMVSKILAYATSLLSEQGVDVLLATMLSQAGAREFLSERVSFLEVHLDAELNHVMKDDIKGIYADNSEKDLPHIVGRDLDFVPPSNPDLVIKTHKETPEEGLEKILQILKDRAIFGLGKNQS